MNNFIIYFDLSDGECSRCPILAICDKKIDNETIYKIQNEVYEQCFNLIELDNFKFIETILKKFDVIAKIVTPDAYIYQI